MEYVVPRMLLPSFLKVVSTATSTPNMVAFSTTAIDQAAAEMQYTGDEL